METKRENTRNQPFARLESFVAAQITRQQLRTNMPIELIRGVEEAEGGELLDADNIFDEIGADLRQQIDPKSWHSRRNITSVDFLESE